MLNLVPLRRARRVVTDGDRESGLLCQSSELDLPGAHTVAVGPTGVRGDEQRRGVGESLGAHLVPPAPDRLDRELRSVCGVADVDPALVVRQVVDAIGDGFGVFAEFGVLEVVHTDPFGYSEKRPFGAPVGEIPNQLLLLRVHADNRLTPLDEGRRRVI